MAANTDQFITQMKLRELREQRARLLNAYDMLSDQAAKEQSDAGKLLALYRGLQQITFATQTLHPDVANLEPLLLEMQTGEAAPETVAFWRARLEKELSNGRLRSEIVYLFGALLDEWTTQPRNGASPDEESAAVRAQLVAQAASAPEGQPPRFALLQDLFAALSFSREEATAQMQKALNEALNKRVETKELAPVLEQISNNPQRPAATRAQARRFRVDDLLQKELADALTIMLERREEWNWPEEGVPVYAAHTPNKWRLFTDDDLPNACFLEILGARWYTALQKFLQEEQAARLKRLRRAGAAEVPKNARQPHQAAGLGLLGEWDIWATTSKETPGSVKEDLSRWVEYGAMEHWSVFRRRYDMHRKLREVGGVTGYGLRETITGMENALMFVNAEVQLARAALPTQPVSLLKVDLKDFYPTLPHDLLLAILSRYGLSATQLAFVRRYLRLPMQDGTRVARAQRGLPNAHALSDALGDLVLGLLEWHLQRVARVQIIRLVDDLCILASSAEEAQRAWQGVQEFCADCGLTLNQEKSGAVCLHGARPAGLPAGPFTWLMLNLESDGNWSVNEGAFEAYLEQTRQQMRQAGPLLAQVEVYNRHLKYLIQGLGLRAPLGEAHRQSANQAMLRFHQALFGERQGIVAALRQGLQARFLGNAPAAHLPEAWFYWPITAGGCGLTHAVILAAAYAGGMAQWGKPAQPEERAQNWQTAQNLWAWFFASFLNEVTPKAPAPNQVMETLVTDFIQRGSEISSGKQKKLAPYWRWILYIYGPHILEALGTFRFLITELVPLQLTNRRHGQSETDEDQDANDDIPF